MEPSSNGDSTNLASRNADQPRVAKPWVKNLLAGQGFALPEDKQLWWSVHLETFLRSARKRGPEIPLEQIVADYLAGLRVEQPPWPEWRLEQVRLALDVFLRGVEHWHWENDAQGRSMPRFRLKCSRPAAGRAATTISACDLGAARGATETRTGKVAPPPGDAQEAVDRVRREVRLAHFTWRTEQSYTEAVASFLRYFPDVPPAALTDAHVKAYLEHLAVDRNVSASTQNQAFSAILFLFRRVLGHDLGELGDTLRAHRAQRLPVVLSREEIARLFAATAGTTGLMIRLMYGTGMRLMECLQLRVKEVDFDRNAILIRSGKGNKDRTVMQKPGLGVRSPLDALGAGSGDSLETGRGIADP